MTETFIHHFIKHFFEENDCRVEEDADGKLVVNLTEDMDKAITNRPFYWKYMEATQQQGVPLQLSFITDKDKRDKNSEWVTYGSQRMQQLEKHLSSQARFTRLFQVKNTEQQTMLQPWLVVNYRLSYEGKQKKEVLHSIGLNLINGIMVSNMMEQLRSIRLDEVISNHCYTISPLIKLESGFRRIEQYIDSTIEHQDHSWAMEAYEKLNEEISMIEYFYRFDMDHPQKEQEIIAAKQRFAPVINHEIISGGVFYLDRHFFTPVS